MNKRIADGTNLPGSRVPGIVELSAEFDIAASTTQKALAHLRDAGEVCTELGLGTFVADSKLAGSTSQGVWPCFPSACTGGACSPCSSYTS
ncbi:GntR family transcriptional regulator [Streptomyces lydicamycinicus]|uniref:GntR family transcriptional regulator n=1 Tax=Streptomyces lydicamycinicus TaxID=1546107 RepID=UPI00099B7FE0|nr:GntR family transcriptional regulator [Streptomyces lydicamycinicus]